MSTIKEYEYDEDHLTESEALERFKAERMEHPNALVILQDLRCGHWSVRVYDSAEEKDEFLYERLNSMFDRLKLFFKV